MKLKDLSLFAGIGAFEKALKNIGIQYELVGFSEIDKYAVKSYCAIHDVDESMNLGDITKIDEKELPKDIDLITYGFPCQDISLAGKQKGLFNEDGTQTRSGLFFEALRIIEETQPRVAIAENVKNLTSKKFSAQFQIVLESLEQAGYNNYWQVLNAKDYGIPQNRERVFIVSIRKDIDTGMFQFPEGFPLELRLKDMLDDVVDEKFYLSEKMIKGFMEHNKKHNEKGTGFIWKPRDIEGCASTLRANAALCPTDNTVAMIGEPQMIQVGQMYGTEREPNPQAGRIYSSDGISPTMDSCSGGNRMPKVLVREATKTGYAEAFEGDSINLEQPNSKTRRGRVGKQVAQTLTTSPQQAVVTNNEPKIDVIGNYSPSGHDASRIVCPNGLAPTVKENHGTVTATVQDLRIRKLTPKECFRLMGFSDEDFEKAEAVNSNTQLYKQAGNSICVPVVEYIIKALLECGALEREDKEMELRVQKPTFPEVIQFNFEELKQEITKKSADYMNLVYAEDQIADAKKDRATLNKFVKALSDERIKIKKECLKPYEDFEAKIKELDGIVNRAIKNIDDQVKGYEEKKKVEKLEQIQEYWNRVTSPEHPLTLQRVMNQKWLNASTSMKTIQGEINDILAKYAEDIATLQNLPEFSFEALAVYKDTLDLYKAISEGKRLAEIQKEKEAQKAEQARLKAEAAQHMIPPAKEAPVCDPPVEELPTAPLREAISFKAYLTPDDALALKEFFNSRGIPFEAI